MKTKNTFLYLIFLVVFSYCSHTFYSQRHATSYVPSLHTFKVDSTYIKKYGKEAAERRIKKGLADYFMVDSIEYFEFYIERKISVLPIIPLFYHIEFQRKKAFYNFQVLVHNNKIFTSLDSVSYVMYDSLKTIFYEGGYNYNLDISKSWAYEYYKTPYIINLRLKKEDVIYGDIKLFLTDYKNRQIVREIKKIKFNYEKRRYFTIYINS